MAANGSNPTTGAPRFLDTDAPDIKVDPQLAANYAADVGNRIVRADKAALDAYAYKREGLEGFAKDTDRTYWHNGVDWVLAADGDYKLQRINFTAASTVVFTGFSALFEHYHAVLNITTSSGLAGGTIRMRSGGSDNSTGTYTFQQDWDSGTAHTAARQVFQTSFAAVPFAGAEHSMEIDFYNPFVAAATRVGITAQSWESPSLGVTSRTSGRHNVTSSFDGFSYTPSTGTTVTGSLTVYGRA